MVSRSLTLSVTTLLLGCGPGATVPSQDNAAYERADRQYQRQLDRADQQLERIDAFYDHADQQNERFDKLIERWEKQSDRVDKLLEKWERQPIPSS